VEQEDIMKALTLAVGLFLSASAEAATFSFDDQHLMIRVDGEMVLSDIATFETLARQGICYDGRCGVQGGVVKHSPGGIAIVGVRMGEIIRQHQMVTFIGKETLCASACAIAWLGDHRQRQTPAPARRE
jgi:hypothetical protein